MKRILVLLLCVLLAMSGVAALAEGGNTLELIATAEGNAVALTPSGEFELSLSGVEVDRTASNDREVAETEGNASYIAINKTNFPSLAFRKLVKAQFDKDGDGKLSDRERKAVKEITVRDWSDWVEGKNKVTCTTLKGIEHFPNLNSLTAVQCGLKTLDVSKNTKLKGLFIYDNKVKKLNLTKNVALEWTNFGKNPITTLNVSKNTNLLGLGVENCKLKSIDVSKNKKLRQLAVLGNPMKKLDVSRNTALEDLYVNKTPMKKLDLSNNKKLHFLWAHDTKIKTIDLKNCPKLRKLLKLEMEVDGDHVHWGDDDENNQLTIDRDMKLTSGSKVLYEGK